MQRPGFDLLWDCLWTGVSILQPSQQSNGTRHMRSGQAMRTTQGRLYYQRLMRQKSGEPLIVLLTDTTSCTKLPGKQFEGQDEEHGVAKVS